MALAASTHRLVGVAPSASSAAAASRVPPRGFLRFHAASPAPLAAARSTTLSNPIFICANIYFFFCYHVTRICCQSVNSANVLGASSSASDESVPVPVVMIDQDSDRDATIVQLSFGDRLGALLDTMKALKDLGLDVTKGTVATDSAVTQTKFHIMRLWVDIDIATHVVVEDGGPKRSMLYIETADRPGLLLEIIKIIADTNIDVESAEIDTEVLINCLRYYLRRPETDEDSY
ncbi:ACT domain-containing protein ACR12 [Dichanthelium oligosanthes]|uniref:ACT domain-containing protein ACR n=1 Tax=Dichanthelium oligosanthes TaxID=888268 RepID=A0A1E5W2Z7_9POAL|nr:ACT domain-containing protein ACR12 [Dichanthelium oligosanthes]